MTATANNWKLGLFIVTGIAVVLSTAAWIGVDRLRRDYRVWYAYFNESVDGLEVGSPVKFLGVPIGEVVEIGGGDPAYVEYVKVTAHLYLDALTRMFLYDPNNPLAAEDLIPPNLRVQLVSSALTGVTFVQAVFSNFPRENIPFETDVRTVPAMPSTLESLSRSLGETLESLPPLAEQATELMRDLDQALLDLDLRDLSQRTRDVLATAEEKLGGLDTEGISADSRSALEEIADFVAELRANDGAVERVVSRLDRLAGSIEQAIEQADLSSTTASLRSAGTSVGGAGDEIAALGRDLRGDVDLLRATLESVRRLADLLERDPGALLHGRSPRSQVGRNR